MPFFGTLGGAVATPVFAGHGAFQVVFPVVFGVLLRGGLLLRNAGRRSLIFRVDSAQAGSTSL